MSKGIKLDQVSFKRGDRMILETISITVPEGEVVALVGGSGVGKTTLLNLINGLMEPSSGTILVDGSPSLPGSVGAVMFQEPSLFGWLTVQENVLFPDGETVSDGRMRGAARLLARLDLPGVDAALPRQLSLGMVRRVELARLLLADSAYFTADEPTTSLDLANKVRAWRVWDQERRERPRTGFISTHDPEEAMRMADRVAVLAGSPARLVFFEPSTSEPRSATDFRIEVELLTKLLLNSEGVHESYESAEYSE